MISVAMATWQGRAHLDEQLDSVLAQLGPDDELVVSDDGSTDGTWEELLARAADDGRIRISRTARRLGVVGNFANALASVHGDIVLLSDQDDVWLPGRVDYFRLRFAEDPDCLLLQVDAEIVDAEGRSTGITFFQLRRCGPGRWRNFVHNTYQGCSLGFRRGLLDVALPFPAGLPMHDGWLGLLAETVGHVSFEPVVLLRHRRHDGNRSALTHAPWNRVLLWRLALADAYLRRWPRARCARRDARTIVRGGERR
jgi:glycosyltransferase involved in cell wall biosynthesis